MSKFFYKKLYIFSFFLLLSPLFALDQKIIDYISDIMRSKNEALGQNVFIHLPIAKASEKFLNIPNAMMNKLYFDNCLNLTSSTVDLFEHLILSEYAQTYTITLVSQDSPYTLKVILPKRRAERMMRSIIEHELGHLYYYHHTRLYAPYELGQLFLAGTIGSSAMYINFASLSKISDYEIPWQPFLVTGSVLYGIRQLIRLGNSSFISSNNWEQEADDFVSDDIEILRGAILHQSIVLEAHTYIYSYDNENIRKHASSMRMNCAEFTQKNRAIAHEYIESQSGFYAKHPLSEDRITRFQDRIEQLKVQGKEDREVEPVSIFIYNGMQIIKEIIV